MTTEILDVDKLRSYASKERLIQAVDKRFAGARIMIVRNSAGRFVALFPVSFNSDLPIGHIIHSGFAVVG